MVEISGEQLAALAGEGAFQRGVDYFHQGQVLSWNQKGKTITADVQGTHIYQVTLTYARQRFEGSCDCPASEGFDFCKHCVAVALAYLEDSQQQAKLVDGSAEERIQAYLNKFGKQELVSHLLEFIFDDRSIKHQWSIKADIALNKMDARAIKKLITAAIPYNRSLYRYHQVRSYFSRMAPVVDVLEEQARQLDPDTALKLVDYALQRIGRALESIDDSGGFRLGVMDQLQELHQSVLVQLEWDKPVLASYLLAIDAGVYVDMYPSIPYGYRELLGEEGMKCVFDVLQQQWDALPPLQVRASWEEKYPYIHLQHLLKQRAEEQGDAPVLLGLLEKTATEERDFLEMCDLCMQQGNWVQAEHWQRKAAELHRPERHAWHKSFRLERTRLRLLVHGDDPVGALQLQWEIFLGSQQIEDYRTLLSLATRVEGGEDYGDRAKSWLRAKIEEASHLCLVLRGILYIPRTTK